MEKPTQPTRTCSVCGLKKPLAAFLQLNVGLGTHYGNICSSCRSKLGKTKLESIEEEWSKAGAGGRIGAKEKAFIDEQKARDLADKKDQEKKEKNKFEFEKTEKDNRDETKFKNDRDRRKSLFQTHTPVTTGEKPAAAKPFTELFESRPDAANEVKAFGDFLVREQKFRSGELGYTPLTLNEMRFHTAMFENLIRSVIPHSPLARFLNLHNKKPSAFGSSTQASETKQHSITHEVEDLIKKTLGPSPRK